MVRMTKSEMKMLQISHHVDIAGGWENVRL